jgi:hypothetical protein
MGGSTDMTNIKSIITEAGSSLTEVAQLLSEKYKVPYTVQSLSNKIRRGSLRYSEALDIFEVLGYEMKLVKKQNDASKS